MFLFAFYNKQTWDK